METSKQQPDIIMTPRGFAPKAEPAPEQPPAPPSPALASVPPPSPLDFTEDAEPFPPEVVTKLARPVNPDLVEVRQPNDLLFVPWVHYQAVLLDAFGPGGYRLVPRSPPRQQGNVQTWHMSLFVRIPGSRRFQFIKDSVGECALHGGMSAGNAAEGAQSDALTKCCKALGIFMELFDPSWRRAWSARHSTQHKTAVKNAAWPAQREAPAQSPKETAASSAKSNGSSPPADPDSQKSTTPATTGEAITRSSASSPATADTGEAIGPEALAALVALLKRLAWKRGQVRMWFSQRFGAKVTEPAALTTTQAPDAYALLSGFGTPVYDRLLAEMIAAGKVAG